MIHILHTGADQEAALASASDISKSFQGRVEVRLVDSLQLDPWPTEANWDDLLIVMFGAQEFSDAANGYIAAYLQTRGDAALLLPVAVDPRRKRPPKAAEAIKALSFDGTAAGPEGRLVRRVGALLGLRVQRRDNQIFISYRANDGTAIATHLEAHLEALG